jgi:hypothetical protein
MVVSPMINLVSVPKLGLLENLVRSRSGVFPAGSFSQTRWAYVVEAVLQGLMP